MDDTNSHLHQDELSKEDVDVLRAFHATEEFVSDTPLSQETTPAVSFSHQSETTQSSTLMSEDDMLVLFATEVDEDIAAMRLSLQQLEQDDHLDSSNLHALKRSAHKVAGTAASIGSDSMSSIAHHMETVIKLMEGGSVVYLTGLIALVHALRALEVTLHSIVRNGYESKNPLLDLEEEYKELGIDIHVAHTSNYSSREDIEGISALAVSQSQADADHTSSSLRVDVRHLNKLIEYTEELIELSTPLENAQKQVETALNELHTAQARLHRLEPLLSSLSVSSNTVPNALIDQAGYPPSSLIARILQEAAERTGHVRQTKSTAITQPLLIHEAALWDEMEIDRFSETTVLTHSLTEAIADITMATTHLRQALAHLKSLVLQQVGQAGAVRNEAFLLQSAPLIVLVTRMKQAIEMMAGAQKEKVQFDASGETIEFDRHILEMLADPFLELVHSSVADSLFFARRSERADEQRLHIWFNAHVIGNEVTMEMGFSQPVSPGAIVALQEAAHHSYGSIAVQERAEEGITLHLRLPRSQCIMQGLLVRAGNQCVIVPVSQVQRIYFSKQGTGKAPSQGASPQDVSLDETHEIKHINALLGYFTDNTITKKTIQTALVLQLDSPQIAVEVDEVVEEVELVMKPLATHLCRPGISSSAVDGQGNVLLIVNLPEIIRLKETHRHAEEAVIGANTLNNYEVLPPQPPKHLRRKILIADDSVYIRRSVNLTLNHEDYDVLEAEDGIHTLELLAKESPDLLLLDIEMPGLNGYDVLNIIRTHQRFPRLKIVMLTSRSSEKHKRRGKELGAHAYLTKPCPQDLLLETIKSLLAEENLPF